MQTDFGLIGKKLSHSFSKKYFEKKFRDLALKNHFYHLFEIQSADEIVDIQKQYPALKGLNVTIPFKTDVIEIMDEIETNALRIGSVNVIKITGKGKLKGYNTDYYGFRKSLGKWLDTKPRLKLSSLVLGSGGASRAVCCVLDDLNIPFTIISRTGGEGRLTYEELGDNENLIESNRLIINTTPLGMFPEINTYPSINYSKLTSQHNVYDLVYNPEETLFLQKSKESGADIKNGLEMLHLQAEKSWEIWSE